MAPRFARSLESSVDSNNASLDNSKIDENLTNMIQSQVEPSVASGALFPALIIKKDAEFSDHSSFDLICFNLKILSQVNQGDKLCIIEGKSLMIEARSGIWRWFSSDNRLATAEFLIELVRQIKNILPISGERLKFLISDLSQAQNGLRNLAATYQSDDVMVAKLQLIRRQMESILNSLY
ncbi:MAG: hypothetical protein WCN88_05045 [Candidatus Falkowbacteria bacterium]